MRLPPPTRRYSAISVIVSTLDTASRPNSRSMAVRSSRSRSKTSRAVDIANVLKVLEFLRFPLARPVMPMIQLTVFVVQLEYDS